MYGDFSKSLFEYELIVPLFRAIHEYYFNAHYGVKHLEKSMENIKRVSA